MKQLVLAAGLVLLTGSMLLSGTARADSDRERQQESNQNRRERQADAINKMDDDNKKEAVEKAHERNQDVRERQKDGNKERGGARLTLYSLRLHCPAQGPHASVTASPTAFLSTTTPPMGPDRGGALCLLRSVSYAAEQRPPLLRRTMPAISAICRVRCSFRGVHS